MNDSRLRRSITNVVLCLLGCLHSTSSEALSLYSGSCEITKYPFEIIKKATICIQDKFQVESLWVIGEPLVKNLDQFPKQRSLAHNRFYTGLHLNSLLSFHYQGSHSEVVEAGLIEHFAPSTSEEYSFIQLGNPLLTPIHGAVGRLDLPFGLDYRVTSESLQTQKRDFWNLYRWGAKLSWVRHDDLKIEAGLASLSPYANLQSPERHRLSMWSARLSKDLADLEGVKLLLSYAHQDKIERKLGFATLNKSRGQATSFEWVRVIPFDGNRNFEQIFRLNHRGKLMNQARWYFEYENIRFHSWNGVIGREHQIFSERFLINFELAYIGQQPVDSRSGWMIESGIQVSL